MKKKYRVYSGTIYLFLLLILSSIQSSTARQALESSDEEMERAIAALRHIVPDKLTKDGKEAKAKEIESNWKIIESKRQHGIVRVKQELEQIKNTNERDDFFKLNAAALLWQMGKLQESSTIAQIWSSTPLTVQYKYVFYTALEAAMLQDPRALPMLKACLKDDRGSVYLAAHALEIKWPLTHEILWGAYGPKGLPTLVEILETSKNSTELETAIILLVKGQYLWAHPRIRKMAEEGPPNVRSTAIQALGLFGHPRDYNFLIAGLSSKNPKEIIPYVYALSDYEDLRVVSLLIPLLDSKDESLRQAVIFSLTHLLTPDSLEALQKHSAKSIPLQEKKECQEFVTNTLKEVDLNWGAYVKKSRKQKEKVTKALGSKAEQKYSLRKGDHTLTHEQLIQVANDWKKNKRITAGKYEWVRERHLLTAATARDIDLLLEINASLYLRLSNECLDEVRRIDELVKRLGRSRYRRTAGLTEKVEQL